MVLDRGRFTQKQPAGDSARGTYTVDGNKVTLTVAAASGGPARNRPGEEFTFRWSLYHGLVTFKAVPGKSSPPPMLAKPWRRVDDAP